jgi:hypothetical protein
MIDRTRLLPFAAASCLALGCGAEVGKDYTGEVLLQFHGSVTYDAPIPDDSVLVLTYQNDNGDILLIDGLIEGAFPSAFRFSTTQLPPVVKEQDLAGDGKSLRVAVFDLAVVPANHPITPLFPPDDGSRQVPLRRGREFSLAHGIVPQGCRRCPRPRPTVRRIDVRKCARKWARGAEEMGEAMSVLGAASTEQQEAAPVCYPGDDNTPTVRQRVSRRVASEGLRAWWRGQRSEEQARHRSGGW